MPRILQITDTHLVVPPALVCGVLDTAAYLREAVASIAATLPKIAPVDAILVTGDVSDDGTPESYRLFRRMLEPLELPVLVIPGNHDKREPMRAAFADLELFPKQGKLNWLRDIDGVRIIGIDTLVEGSAGGEIDDATLDFLAGALDTTEPMLIAMHHPPFATDVRFLDTIGLASIAGLGACLEKARTEVRIVCGHVHLEAMGMVGRTPAISGPSTCSSFDVDFRSDAPVGFFTGGGGFMVHDWSGSFRSTLIPPARGEGPFPF